MAPSRFLFSSPLGWPQPSHPCTEPGALGKASSLPPSKFCRTLQGAPACPALPPTLAVSGPLILVDAVRNVQVSSRCLMAPRGCHADSRNGDGPRVSSRGCRQRHGFANEPATLMAAARFPWPLAKKREAGWWGLIWTERPRPPTAVAQISSASSGARWQPGRAQPWAEPGSRPDGRRRSARPPLSLRSRGASDYE